MQMIQEAWLEDVYKKIIHKMEWVSQKNEDKIPYTTKDGVYDDYRKSHRNYRMSEGINWWTNGFWAGMLWQMYHETGNDKYATIARRSEEWLDDAFKQYDGLHHDVGFMWLHTGVANYRLTGDVEGRRRGLHAANLLAGRFNPVGRFIRAWNEHPHEDRRGWAIIDCMMNIPLLYWATEETKDPRFGQIAQMHADTVRKNFVRPDGSVEHIVEFDPMTGDKVRIYAGQGYKEGSSWTRGQAWALYGFMLSYVHTHREEYLNTAKQVAHYFIANIPESGIIPCDFRQPKDPMIEDSTAAAIAACGLIEISKVVGEGEKALYLEAAMKLVRTLAEKRCDFTEGEEAMVLKGTEAYHSDGHHMTIIYGDYFFMEAVNKLRGSDLQLW